MKASHNTQITCPYCGIPYNREIEVGELYTMMCLAGKGSGVLEGCGNRFTVKTSLRTQIDVEYYKLVPIK